MRDEVEITNSKSRTLYWKSSAVASLRAARELSPEIRAHGGLCDLGARFAFGPLHDDVAADESHDRPTGHIPALIDGPGRHRMEKILCDLRPPLQIDDDQIRIGPGENHAFFGIEAEDPRGVFTGDPRETYDRDPPLVHALAQHHGKHPFHARRKA